jgi:hypothetical protein
MRAHHSAADPLRAYDRRRRRRTRGLKITASTAANVRGRTISLTAASATTTMIVAATTPTKPQDHTPSLGNGVGLLERRLGVVSRPAIPSP